MVARLTPNSRAIEETVYPVGLRLSELPRVGYRWKISTITASAIAMTIAVTVIRTECVLT